MKIRRCDHHDHGDMIANETNYPLKFKCRKCKVSSYEATVQSSTMRKMYILWLAIRGPDMMIFENFL